MKWGGKKMYLIVEPRTSTVSRREAGVAEEEEEEEEGEGEGEGEETLTPPSSTMLFVFSSIDRNEPE